MPRPIILNRGDYPRSQRICCGFWGSLPPFELVIVRFLHRVGFAEVILFFVQLGSTSRRVTMVVPVLMTSCLFRSIETAAPLLQCP